MAIKIGCVSITWNQFKRSDPDAWPEERILAEIAQVGYEGASAGPRSDRTPDGTIALYARHGLKVAPSYLGGAFWKPEAREEILERARRQADWARAVGLTELFVAANGGEPAGHQKTRRDLAGHVGPNDGLGEQEYKRFADTLNEVGAICRDAGVRACFHNHVGTVIETRDEIDALMAVCDPDLVFLGPDTGHLAWGGADVLAFCRDYAPRIKAMHLKDIDADVAAKGQAEDWSYGQFTAAGVFAELGEGSIDFPAVLSILREQHFDGWLLAETDVTQKPSALESVTISRAYLKGLGV